MGQQQSIARSSLRTSRAYPLERNEQFYNKRIEHEGLIKLRPVPFKNCIEIQTESGSLFVQNIEITLKDLLQSRLYTNKLFPKQDIERLIENITYTLAFLQQNQISYKDVSSQNIFYDDGAFKLLPNQLIPHSRYQKFINSKTRKPNIEQQQSTEQQFIPLSPQMIIAFRCKQHEINDVEIIDKSNVFYLGILLLEVTTLLPSHECYDIETCDILDEVVTDRIQLVREYYSEEIASIVANMLDYDYAERMSLKELSIFVNRELNREITLNSKISKELSNKKSRQNMHHYNEPICSDPMADEQQTFTNQSQAKSVNICKSRVSNCEQSQSRISRPCQIGNISQKKKNKTNKVYMNGMVQQQEQESTFTKEERNKVYMNMNMKKSQQPQEEKRNNQNQLQTQNLRSTTPLKQLCNSNISASTSSLMRAPTGKVLNMTSQQKFSPSIPSFTQKPKQYQVSQDEENQYFPDEQYSQKKNFKNKNSRDYLGYRATPTQIVKTPKQEVYHQKSKFQYEEEFKNQSQEQNNYLYHNSREESDFAYPGRNEGSFGQRYNQRQSSLDEDSGSGYYQVNKPVAPNSRANNKPEFKEQDNSLSRIKSQIERSRKLIEEFKRSEAHY